MDSTQIPKDFNKIKSKFQKIDEANKRRLEIIKNKDKIEKSVSDIETIFEKIKNLDKMNIQTFLNEKPEEFIKNYDIKIDEIEKRRTGLKIVQEMANEKIELLQLFPDILESEKGKEIIRKIEIINGEIDNCENIKLKINEMKNDYENEIKIEEQYRKVINSYKETRLISIELMKYDPGYHENDASFLENIDDKIEKVDEYIQKLTRMSNEMYVIINEVLPKSKKNECVELYEYVNDIKSYVSCVKEELIEKKNTLINGESYTDILNSLKEISSGLEDVSKVIDKEIDELKDYKEVLPLFYQFTKGKTIEISINGRPREILELLTNIYEEKNKIFNEVKSKKIHIDEPSELYDPLIRKLETLKEKNNMLENIMNELIENGVDRVDLFNIKNLIKEIEEEHNNYKGKKMLHQSIKKNKGILNVSYAAIKIFVASEIIMGIYVYITEKSIALYNGGLFFLGLFVLAGVQIFDKEIYEYLEKRNKK